MLWIWQITQLHNKEGAWNLINDVVTANVKQPPVSFHCDDYSLRMLKLSESVQKLWYSMFWRIHWVKIFHRRIATRNWFSWLENCRTSRLFNDILKPHSRGKKTAWELKEAFQKIHLLAKILEFFLDAGAWNKIKVLNELGMFGPCDVTSRSVTTRCSLTWELFSSSRHRPTYG